MTKPASQLLEETSEFMNPNESLLINDDEDLVIIEDEQKTLDNEVTLSISTDIDTTSLNEAYSDIAQSSHKEKCWKIIIVDDDPIVHQATLIALKNFTFEGTRLEFISAFSAREGKKILDELNDEPASILLDVVMESNHAGLDLVEYIRESLNNKRIRIIIRTGQPGEAPSESVILDYDINDYQLKVDMTRQRLITSIVAALRSYRDLVTIDEQNKLLTDSLDKLKQSELKIKHYSYQLEVLVSERTAELQQANTKLKQIANLDGLTQIANRQCFDDYLKQHWQDKHQHQKQIALLLIDVDYFKAFNDCYGHLVGDDALKQVAHALSATLMRSYDLTARYGGEEFGVILPEANYPAAIRIAKEIFKQIESLKIPHQGSQVSEFLTISMGISCLIPQDSMSPKSLIEMADMALYRAKELGRNQYCLY